jgi:hypothetical protein
MSYVNLILRPLFAFLLCASPAFAASLSIIPSGDSAYTVQGAGMDSVAGIQLNITYDAASLATPTVAHGGLVAGAMLAANTSLPGLIKIAIISTKPFSGNGLIATISFASKPGSGGITSANVSMINSAGTAVPASVSIANASGSLVQDPSSIVALPFTQPAQPAQTTPTTTATTTAAPATTTAQTYPGTITLPTDQMQRTDSQPAPAPSSPTPATDGEPPAIKIADQSPPSDKPAADVKPVETPQYVVYQGISDRFKLYNGSKKLSAIALLFNKEVVQTIHQEPAIVLSSGQNKATLTVDIPARISSSPNVAVSGGKLVSFKQSKQVKGRWTVEVLPKAGSVKVTMTIIAGAEEFEYPLTVAPPIKTALTLDESGWNRFLKEVGTAKAPLHDFNNDGVRNYMDEFIFVANYLANKKTPAKQTAIPSAKPKTTTK